MAYARQLPRLLTATCFFSNTENSRGSCPRWSCNVRDSGPSTFVALSSILMVTSPSQGLHLAFKVILRSCTLLFCMHLIGQNSVTWPQLAAKAAGKCSACCRWSYAQLKIGYFMTIKVVLGGEEHRLPIESAGLGLALFPSLTHV